MKQLRFGYLALGTSVLWVGYIFWDANAVWVRGKIGGIVSFCMFLEEASDRKSAYFLQKQS